MNLPSELLWYYAYVLLSYVIMFETWKRKKEEPAADAQEVASLKGKLIEKAGELGLADKFTPDMAEVGAELLAKRSEDAAATDGDLEQAIKLRIEAAEAEQRVKELVVNKENLTVERNGPHAGVEA